MNPSRLSVHESHDFAYCKHYQYFILSPKYRLLHAYHLETPISAPRCQPIVDIRADRADMGIGMS